MHRPAVLAATLVAALALVVPTGVARAQQDPASPSSVSARKAALTLSLSARSSQVGQPGVHVTAHVKGRVKRPAKVVFKVDGVRLDKVRAKATKAKTQLPSTLAPGVHTVTARLGRLKASTSVRVDQTVLTLSSGLVTLYRSTSESAQPRLSGSVVVKGAPATSGYVDLYRDGATSGGRESPGYLVSATVQPDGTFDLETRFAAAVLATYPGGVYVFDAFYAPGTNFSRYVVSSTVSVIVTD